MPLDQTELDQIKADAATGKISDLIAPLSTLGLTLRTAQDEISYTNTLKSDTIKDRDRELYTQIEEAIEAETGIKKNNGEKATDYLKRATGGLKTELQTLKDKKDDGTATNADKTRIKELEALVGTKDTDLNKLKDEHAKQLSDFRTNAVADNALLAVTAKLKKDLVGSDLIADSLYKKFKTEYTPVFETDAAGKETIAYKKGETFENNSGGKRKTAVDILTELFDPYLIKEQQQAGTGTGGNSGGSGGNSNPSKDSYTVPADVTTQQQLSEDLKKKGFTRGSEDYNALYKEHSKNLKLF